MPWHCLWGWETKNSHDVKWGNPFLAPSHGLGLPDGDGLMIAILIYPPSGRGRFEFNEFTAIVEAKKLVKNSQPRNVAWIEPNFQEWRLDLDSLKESHEALKPLDWLHGSHTLAPNFVRGTFDLPGGYVGPFHDAVAFYISAEFLATSPQTDKPPDEHGKAISVFISHSSHDKDLASLLADLLRSALNLRREEIRCTTVDAYRLPGGVDTDEQLRREVYDARTFIGIISPASLASIYVVFELGARWGANKHLLPLLAPGVDARTLATGPLAGINALSCDSSSQLHQFIGDVASVLGVRTESPQAYNDKIEAIAALSRQQNEQTEQAVRPAEQLRSKNGELRRASAPPSGCESLAQGKQSFTIQYSVTHGKHGQMTTDTRTLDFSWDDIFCILAPPMIDPAEQSRIRGRIDEHLLSLDPVFDGRYQTVIFDGITTKSFDTILIQLQAIGLIRRDDGLWTLTPYGDDEMTKLMAIRR